MSSYSPGSKVAADFNTADPLTLEPISIAGATVVVYRDDSATPITAGVTLDVDKNGITGWHTVDIDTGADEDDYLDDHTYRAVVAAGTVSGISVAGAVLKRFTLLAAPVELDEEQIEDIADAVIAGAAPNDLNIEAVPASRTFLLTPTTDGFVSEDTKKIIAGTPGQTYAVDFRNVAAANQKIYSIDSVELVDGDEDGVTLTEADDCGREGTQAKLSIAGVTAGDYQVRVVVTFTGPAGPPGRGDILFTVVS